MCIKGWMAVRVSSSPVYIYIIKCGCVWGCTRHANLKIYHTNLKYIYYRLVIIESYR